MSMPAQRWLHVILTAAAFIGCLFFSIPAALILLGLSAVLFIVTGIVAYGLGVVDVPFPYMPMCGGVALLVTNVLLVALNLIDEYRASFTAIAFIERQYGACGRKASRCASFLKEALVTYAWTGITYVFGSVALVLLLAIA